MIKRTFVLVFALALVGAGCTSDDATQPGPTAGPTGTGPTSPGPPPEEVGALPTSLVRFADYVDVPLLDPDAPAYAGPPTPASLEGVLVADDLRAVVADPEIERALLEHGFVVVPADLPLFHFAYLGNLYEGWPVFVTTDAAYHVWHQVFDKLLRSLEQEVLLPELEELVAGLLDGAGAQVEELEGTPLAEAASRVEQLFQVAAAELGLPVEPGALAERELELIEAHSAPNETSPIVGGKIDYSLFTPRGHYTRNGDLTRYFLGMSVLGQLAFCLPGTTGCPSGVEPARLGVLSSRVLTSNERLVERWRRIYEPTAFLVGLADDYGPDEVAAAAEVVAPNGLADPMAFADDPAVVDLLDVLLATRPVRINPDRASIRMMGTRFVIDSFVFDQLIAPNVGTPEKARTLPSALDLPAAMGSEFAYQVLESLGETDYANYDRQLTKMRDLLGARSSQDWGGTVYDAWLHALEPSFVERGAAYPDFMRGSAWAAKAHQSGLGSFAELRHDTILYAKQAIGEGGDGAPVPDRRNWVEPDPVVFGRLGAMAELMRAGLDKRALITDEQSILLRDAIDLFDFLQRVATDELAGRPISAVDNQRLTDVGHELEAMWFRTSDQTPSGVTESDEQAAIVADVASDPSSVVEVGTGRIDRILVLVPDDDGGFQLAAGGVYSFYEFTTPAGERLSDELWRDLLDAGEEPERPAWERVIFGG
jgi:hypothetical protein